MPDPEGSRGPVRVRRLAMELRVRRRRLDAFAAAPDWPGKGRSLHWEQVRYDQLLLLAAQMLEVPTADECPLPAILRAVLEDTLALAGLDVFASDARSGDPFEDDDLIL